MIKAQVIKKSGLMELLSNAQAIEKQIKVLESAEGKYRAQQKKLLDGQSLVKWRKEQESLAEKAQQQLIKAQKDAADELHVAKAAAEEVQAELKKTILDTNKKKRDCTELRKKLKEELAEQESCSARIKKAVALAEQDKAAAKEAREQYEAKLLSLKNSIAGLSGA